MDEEWIIRIARIIRKTHKKPIQRRQFASTLCFHTFTAKAVQGKAVGTGETSGENMTGKGAAVDSVGLV